MRKKLLSLAVVIALLSAVGVEAAEVSTDQAEDFKTSKEKSLSDRNSKEKRKSTSRRRSSSTSTGRDRTATDSAKRAANLDAGHSLDATLPAAAIFLPLPGSPVPPLVLPADVGLSGVSAGWTDTTAQEAFAAAARGNARLSAAGVDEGRIRQYITDLLLAGAVLGQATLNLQQDAARVGVITKEKSGEVVVHGLGADDLQKLAGKALTAAEKNITDPRISNVINFAETANCRFVGDVSVIACGKAVVTLSAPPTLKVAGVPWFDAEKGFAGISGVFRVSSSWSMNQALESLKSDSRYSKVAQEASRAAEELESQGGTREAALARRKVLDSTSASKAGMSPAKYIPNINQ